MTSGAQHYFVAVEIIILKIFTFFEFGINEFSSIVKLSMTPQYPDGNQSIFDLNRYKFNCQTCGPRIFQENICFYNINSSTPAIFSSCVTAFCKLIGYILRKKVVKVSNQRFDKELQT
ncbi:CLUMA_CG001148, isoform A [Clunio marinus]|uniref:CLUMA_CG001148, isoform A n=1 Tax=Clunio marinus TaxID=568069 RepID=A0A1J1HIG5_9DIPT|nr:CLUMA_CG001148, isoform A [Clunio marinus]